MRLTVEALYGPGGGVCAAPGPAFSFLVGDPMFPSWDLVDTSRRGWRRCVTRTAADGHEYKDTRGRTAPGTERPKDMRLVGVMFNQGRNVWPDDDWWTMAERVRDLLAAGVTDFRPPWLRDP